MGTPVPSRSIPRQPPAPIQLTPIQAHDRLPPPARAEPHICLASVLMGSLKGVSAQAGLGFLPRRFNHAHAVASVVVAVAGVALRVTGMPSETERWRRTMVTASSMAARSASGSSAMPALIWLMSRGSG